MNAHDALRLVEAAGVAWLTRQQAAEHAQVSIRTIDRWIARGLPRSGGNGELTRIRLDALEDWMEHRGDQVHSDPNPT